jgi:murein DD-endopeptidase MepM/ murein hydrolase activator NlpD
MAQLKLEENQNPKYNSYKKKIIIRTGVAVAIVAVITSLALVFRVSPIPLKKRVFRPVHNRKPAAKPKDAELVKIEDLVRRGDTIINTLKREGIDHSTAYKLFTDIIPVYNLKKINTGKKYTLFLTPEENDVKKFIYEIDANQYLEVDKDDKNNCFTGKIITIPYEVRREVVKGTISYSLFESLLACGEKPELADILASLFEYDVDFNRDIQPKDSFAVIVEKKFLEGEFVGYGDVLASEFINNGKVIRVVRYTDPEGNTAYYHPDGRSVRKMFLRCPLPFMRVTSSYGYRRRHPVLGFSAQHNGVDFGAPAGTKVRASAAGVVQQVGFNRYKGRFIAIRHPNHYVSHYYHLSRRANNIKPGVRVEQGELIGYVGSTGLSTGPHLHYGLQKNGRFINPLMLKSPTIDPVKKIYFEDFQHYAARHFLVLSGSQLVTIPKPIQDVLLPSTNSRGLLH